MKKDLPGGLPMQLNIRTLAALNSAGLISTLL